MHKATHPDERLQNLLERGKADGFLPLSVVETLIEAVGLDEDASSALLDEIASREIVLRDDCGRDLPEPTYVNGDIAETTTDALQLFFRDLSRDPLLTAAEEVELARGIERGDASARALERAAESAADWLAAHLAGTPPRKAPGDDVEIVDALVEP